MYESVNRSEMSTPLSESRKRRVHSAGERVVLAIAIATPGGVGSLTIRLLAQHRGVKPMAIRTRLLTDTSSRADEPALSLEMCSQAESGPGSHVGSQRAGLSQTTADQGERLEAWSGSSQRPNCDS